MKGFSIILLLVGLSACDAFNTFNGIVIDSDSKKPDSGVAIFRIENVDYYKFTDNNGAFQFMYTSATHHDEEFLFYKPGYIPAKKKLKDGGVDTIYLQRK